MQVQMLNCNTVCTISGQSTRVCHQRQRHSPRLYSVADNSPEICFALVDCPATWQTCAFSYRSTSFPYEDHYFLEEFSSRLRNRRENTLQQLWVKSHQSMQERQMTLGLYTHSHTQSVTQSHKQKKLANDSCWRAEIGHYIHLLRGGNARTHLVLAQEKTPTTLS